MRVASISAAHCRPFISALSAEGVDPRRQLATLGISDPDQSAEPQQLSFAQFSAFLKLLELGSPRADLGLRAGAQMKLTQLGLFGLLLRSSHDGQDALRRHQMYGDVIRETLPIQVSLQHGAIECRPPSGMPRTRFFSQYFCASIVSAARQLHGQVEPVEVSLSYPAPSDLREHVRVLGRRLRFGASEDAVVFPADQLSRTLVHRDPDVAAVLERHVAALVGPQQNAEADLRARARQLIALELPRGQLGMPELARTLGLSERTLRRQLEKLGCSYQSLLDDARRERALQSMHEGLSGPQVGRDLGFTNASAFRRAFRRWTGRAWSEYRKQALGE